MKNQGTPVHIFKGNFVWDMPDLHAESTAHEGPRLHRQRLAALRRLERPDRRGVLDRLLLPEQRRQREPDRVARLSARGSRSSATRAAAARTTSTSSSTRRRLPGRPTAATAWSRAGTTCAGCGQSIWDLSLARNIRLGGRRSLQFRAEVYNAFNSAFVHRAEHHGARSTTRPTRWSEPAVQRGRHPGREPARSRTRRASARSTARPTR